MKLNQLFSKIYLLVILFFVNSVFGQNSIEEKIKNITLQLRCMTCQNQSIYDSDSDFSNDIKKIIKNQLQEGKNEKEIINFLVERFGEYILFKPLVNKKNIFLWVFPFALFIISLIFIGIRIKKNQSLH